jgi:hypoxanthine phosphoribosyltransferase
MAELLQYSFDHMSADVDLVVSNYKDKGIHEVVGIMRGGIVPAVMLSHKLNVPCRSVYWSTRDANLRDLGGWADIVNSACEGRKFLIVDDILDSGRTIKEMISIAKKVYSIKLWGNNIKFTTLWYNPSNDYLLVPDFHVNDIDRKEDDRWVVFPYEG